MRCMHDKDRFETKYERHCRQGNRREPCDDLVGQFIEPDDRPAGAHLKFNRTTDKKRCISRRVL